MKSVIQESLEDPGEWAVVLFDGFPDEPLGFFPVVREGRQGNIWVEEAQFFALLGRWKNDSLVVLAP